jgi:GT2 family glycosyltransferase
MRYSVIIPTYKRPELLSACLKCLEVYLLQDSYLLGFEVEVIVTDDEQNSDDTRRVIKPYPTIIWNQGPGRGPAANRNSGVAASSGECLVFLDDDCLPQAGWLEAYHLAYASGCVLEGKTIADRAQCRYDEESPVNETGGYLWSCNFAVDRRLFDRLKGFDESYIYAAMEDADFRERLLKAGVSLEFVADAVIIHPWRIVSGLDMLKRRWKSEAIFWDKHPEARPDSVFRLVVYRLSRSVAKTTLRNLWRFRLRGLGYQLKQDTYVLYLGVSALLGKRL